MELVAAFEEAFSARDWERLGQTLAESVAVIDPISPELIQAQRGRGHVPDERRLLSHGSHRGRATVWDGDWVCVENVETGAQRDSEKQYRIDTCYTLKVLNEELAEIRFYYDALGMKTQLGMSP